MILAAEEPDAIFDRAIPAGATEIAPVCDRDGWRNGRLTDPFGHHWQMSSPANPRNAQDELARTVTGREIPS